MRRLICDLVVLTRCSLLSSVREPASFLWNVAFPAFLMIFVQRAPSDATQVRSLIEFVAPFVVYVIFANSIWGGGMNAVFWRESGFFRAFMQGRRAKLRLILSMFFATLVFNLLSVALVLVAARFRYGVPFTAKDAVIAPVLLLLSLFYSWASLVVCTFRTTTRTTTTLMNVANMAFFVISTALHGRHGIGNLRALTYFNPLEIGRGCILSFSGGNEVIMWAMAGSMGLFLLGGFLGYFRVNPVSAEVR